MSPAEEDIVEREPRFRGFRTRFRSLLLAAISVGGVAALSVAARQASRSDNPSPAPSTFAGTATSAPLASASPSPIVLPRLTGVGPFLVFQGDTYQRDEVKTEVFAVDLGDPGRPPVRLGRVLGEVDFIGRDSQVWGTAVPIVATEYEAESDSRIATTRIWTVSRGRGLEDPPMIVGGNVTRHFTSPDWESMVLLVEPAAGSKRLDVWLVQPGGGARRYRGSISRSGISSDRGDLTPVAWLPGGGWLAVPLCQCDVAPPDAWYTFSESGSVEPATWMGKPTDVYPSVSSDGRFVAFTHTHTRDCSQEGPDDPPCLDGPEDVLLADTMSRRVRRIARYPDAEAQSAVLSPDASRIAVWLYKQGRLEILDATSGKVLAAGPGGEEWLEPLAFIDPSTLLVKGADFMVATIEAGRLQLRRILPIESAQSFLGWVE